MKLDGQPCQPPVPEPYVQVTLHTALPETQGINFYRTIYLTFTLFLRRVYPLA